MIYWDNVECPNQHIYGLAEKRHNSLYFRNLNEETILISILIKKTYSYETDISCSYSKLYRKHFETWYCYKFCSKVKQFAREHAVCIDSLQKQNKIIAVL